MKAIVYYDKNRRVYTLVEQINEDPEGIWITYINLLLNKTVYEKLPDETERILLSYEV